VQSSNIKGVVAAGHEETARAAELILQQGGNAFDAVVAAHFAACVAEPVLTSLGGGGYLLAHAPSNQHFIYDFFVQTPRAKRPAIDLDFKPIHADFGTAKQEFHIGLGAIATPGTIKGLYAIHRDLCTLPMDNLLEPIIFKAIFLI
jgi:gamma-glutamyltranspeptidase/glutathione hydrolase